MKSVFKIWETQSTVWSVDHVADYDREEQKMAVARWSRPGQ